MSWKDDISRIVVLSVVLLSVTTTATACSIDFPKLTVRSTFRVKIYYENKPISGIEIGFYRNVESQDGVQSQRLFARTSDKNGVIKIENLPAGEYFISVISPGSGGAAELVVQAQRISEAKKEIELGWPAKEIVKAKHVVGVLFNENEVTQFQDTVLKNTDLALWKPGVQSPIETTTTDSNGQFRFQESQPGIYILRVMGPYSPISPTRGDIAVEIMPVQSEGPDFLPLHLTMTSCGIYTSFCPLPAVMDFPSGPVQFKDLNRADAEFLVEDAQGRQLVTGKVDSKGIANIPSGLEGKVKLKLSTRSFNLTQPVNFTPSSSNSTAAVLRFSEQSPYSPYGCRRLALETDAAQK